MTDTIPPTSPETTPEQPAKKPVPVKLIAASAGVLLVAAIAIIVAVNVTAKSPFETAISECGLEASTDVSLGDGGNTMIVNGEGTDSVGASIETIACVVNELQVPDSTIAKMDSTRALDGVQNDEFNGIKVQWSYHPDSGLDAIYSR